MTVATNGGDATDGADGDLTGTRFAGLEVGAVVGRDLVSTIYQATEHEPDDEAVTRPVMLRVVARDLCAGEGDERQLYRRFVRHVAQALTFEHPNALMAHEVGEYAGRGYVISAEPVSIPFSAYVDRVGPLDPPVALALFEQVADVLDAGHRAGLTHGAVNPSTLRILAGSAGDEGATVQLMGHGLGALLELRIRRDRRHMDVVDELLYVAPEQLRRQPPTGRTDQYAMACALVHALTGAPPFVRDSVGGLFGAHLFVAPQLDDHVVAPAVGKALSKEPRERYGTCGQVIADIERAQRSAANRRRAASRRRRAAHPSAPADSGGVVTASPARVDVDDGGRDRVRTSPERNGDAPSPVPPSPGAASPTVPPLPGDASQTVPPLPGDASPTVSPLPGDGTGDDADDAGAIQRSRMIDDNSSTAPHQPAQMSYSSTAQGPADGVAAYDEEDFDTMPLLSDVLRQSPAAQRAAWRPPGGWLAVVILVLAAVAAAVWLIAT